MKKYLICVICIIVCILLCICVAFISENYMEKPQDSDRVSENDEDTPKATVGAILDKAKSWMEDNYKEVYDLRNISAELVSIDFSSRRIKFTVALSSECKLKYANVYEMPFVKGMQKEVESRELEDYQQKAVDDYIREIEEDANFGNYSELNLEIFILVNATDSEKPWKLYYSDGIGYKLDDIEGLRPDPDELFKQGEEAAKSIIDEATP